MTIALRYAARSDVGLLREGNEDSAYASGRLLAVADGMGGHAHGEVASSVAIAALSSLDADAQGGDLLSAIEAAVRDANRKLHEMVGRDPGLKGMGTTLTAMLWSGTRVALVHVGDSRAYLLRAGELYQITHDHTLVQSLVDDGRITAEEAATHPQRSILLRALDGSGEVDPDLSLREAQVGDRYLLCSDGLSGVVSAETLHHTLSTIEDPDGVVRTLIDLANRGGGPDNITCVLADVLEVAETFVPRTEAAVVGAAGSGMPRSQPPDTPAGRASAVTMPQPVIPDDDPDEPIIRSVARPAKRRRLWPLVAVAGGVVVIGGGLGWYFGGQWLDDQYFVGAKGNEIVVFQGVKTNLGPFELFDVARSTTESISTLGAFQQGQVRDGIPVPTVEAGLEKIEELKSSAAKADEKADEKAEPTTSPSASASSTPPVPRAPEPTRTQ
ncbi:protein phosphatase 2C domain-containing protein [Streptosporangium sp. NBC_01755]|uniref:PP2C family protein-serine/threonine phosphatase n=1 Tax=unclassified Streptosporangium TaxID=2632669 RepID=UPI002DDBD297|nr:MULTISPECIES: PP2C family serine/threonine-protein phosphatase [unclassified Streptosporangium]WSA25189.1 protein phosphatase 2C domain-containing protein [Streptosporangium sp. NBC_01810]WSD03471.1 protein phosphatase 2C domain-containing protein [Streptosporangium sp. NBC_01755]